MDILNEILEIRHLTFRINKKEIENKEIFNFIKSIYPEERTINLIEDNELKNMYCESLIDLSKAISDSLLSVTFSEEILNKLLSVVSDQKIKRNIFEQLLEVKKIKDNPFNDAEYVNMFNNKIKNYCSEFEFSFKLEEITSANYHPSVQDGVRNVEIHALIKKLEYQMKELFCEKNIHLLSQAKKNELKVLIVQNLIGYFSNPSFFNHVKFTRDFEKIFFKRLKEIDFRDEYLEAKVNERIYGINFDTKGMINKFEKLKKRVFTNEKRNDKK